MSDAKRWVWSIRGKIALAGILVFQAGYAVWMLIKRNAQEALNAQRMAEADGTGEQLIATLLSILDPIAGVTVEVWTWFIGTGVTVLAALWFRPRRIS